MSHKNSFMVSSSGLLLQLQRSTSLHLKVGGQVLRMGDCSCTVRTDDYFEAYITEEQKQRLIRVLKCLKDQPITIQCDTHTDDLIIREAFIFSRP